MKLCIKCRVNLTENKNHRCTDCGREYYRNYYRVRKGLGLCTRCHRKNDSDILLCKICSDTAQGVQNKRKRLAKENFLCVVCGKQTDGKHTECEKCRIDRNNKYIQLADEAAYNGKCCLCRKNIPKIGLRTCDKCLKRSSEHYRSNAHDRKELKLLVLDHYGNKCACCGEINELLLNIDHINNDGNMHRKTTGGGTIIYKEIVFSGFPSSYQILCWNCNMGKYLNNGVCPHKQSPKMCSEQISFVYK